MKKTSLSFLLMGFAGVVTFIQLRTAFFRVENTQHRQQKALDTEFIKKMIDLSSGTATAFDKKNTTADQHEQVKKKKPMNIILFYADDWTFRTLGAVNDIVKTPNIDGMARNGMLFTHNCVTTSICWISRATLYTGMYASRHQQFKISSENMFDKTVQWNQTLYPLLKNAGYHTGFVGKWHHPQPPEHMKNTFDYRNLYYGRHWMERDGKRRHVTDLNQEDALHYLTNVRPRDKPFALTVSFFATHSWDGNPYPDQYMPMNYSRSWYANGTIPAPKTATQQSWEDMPWFFTERNEVRYRWRRRYNTEERFQDTMKKYYRMASEVDAACGALISELKKQGVYDNTLLVFTTDNGQFHNEHLLAGKWYPHEESIRVPLVIQGKWKICDDNVIYKNASLTFCFVFWIPLRPSNACQSNRYNE